MFFESSDTEPIFFNVNPTPTHTHQKKKTCLGRHQYAITKYNHMGARLGFQIPICWSVLFWVFTDRINELENSTFCTNVCACL